MKSNPTPSSTGHRHSFASVLLAALLAGAAGARDLAELDDKLRVPILQGATSERETQFSILLHKPVSPAFRVWRRDGTAAGDPPVEVRRADRPFSPWVFYTVKFQGLVPGRDYVLDVLEAEGRLADQRLFQTLVLGPRSPRIAVVSCARDNRPNRTIMWEALIGAEPEMLFFLGDNVYVDNHEFERPIMSEEIAWRRYAETRNLLAIYRAARLIPTIATWDDHDTWLGNSGADSPFLESASRMFQEAYAQDPIPGVFERGPGGIASRFHAFGLTFHFMDNRTFRSGPGAAYETHWGREQESWLLAGIAAGGGRPAWILSGSEFFGAYNPNYESYEKEHPRNFDWFLKELGKLRAPVVFFSGDRHFSEIMRIEDPRLGYATFEIMSSPIHAFSKPVQEELNPERRIAMVNASNFIVVEPRVEAGRLHLDATCMGEGGQVYFKRRMQVGR